MKPMRYIIAGCAIILGLAALFALFIFTHIHRGKYSPQWNGELLIFQHGGEIDIADLTNRSITSERMSCVDIDLPRDFHVSAAGIPIIVQRYGEVISLEQIPSGAKKLKYPAGIYDISAVSSDGTRVYTTAYHGDSVIYDVKKRKVLFKLPAEHMELNHAQFSRDNRFFAGADGDGVLWLLDQKTAVFTKLGKGCFQCFSPTASKLAWVENSPWQPYKGKLAYLVSAGTAVAVYDCITHKKSSYLMPTEFDSGLAWSPDGKSFAYLGRGPDQTPDEYSICIIKTNGKRPDFIPCAGLCGLDFYLLWLPPKTRNTP